MNGDIKIDVRKLCPIIPYCYFWFSQCQADYLCLYLFSLKHLVFLNVKFYTNILLYKRHNLYRKKLKNELNHLLYVLQRVTWKTIKYVLEMYIFLFANTNVYFSCLYFTRLSTAEYILFTVCF